MSTTKNINDLKCPQISLPGVDDGSCKKPEIVFLHPEIHKYKTFVEFSTNHQSYIDLDVRPLQADNLPTACLQTFREIIDGYSQTIRGLLDLKNIENSPVKLALLDWIDDLIWLFLRLCVDSTPSQRVFSVVHFIKIRYKSGKSLPAAVFSRVNQILDMLQPGPHLQSGDSSPLRSLLDNWSRLNESPLALKMRSLLAYCMSFSILEVFGLPPQFSDIVYDEFNVDRKVPKKKVTGIVYAILDVVEFIFNKARECLKTGSFSPLIHAGDTYSRWYDASQKVFLWSKCLNYPEGSNFCIDDYVRLLHDCVDKGDQLVQFADSKPTREKMTKILNELKVLKSDDAISNLCCAVKATPLGVLIFGEPSTGKTSFGEVLYKTYSEITGTRFDDKSVWAANTDADFDDGYKGQPFVTLDDVAAYKPSKVMGIDKTLGKMLQIINPAPYVTNQAAIEDKGRIPMRAKMVIVTTNVENLNLDVYYQVPAAIFRRLAVMVEIKPKPQYANGPQLDGSKVPPAKPGVLSDHWLITVYRYIPPESTRVTKSSGMSLLGKKEMVLENVDMTGFLCWYVPFVKKFIRLQNVMLLSQKHNRLTPFCEHDMPTTFCLSCNGSMCSEHATSLKDCGCLCSCGVHLSKDFCYNTEMHTITQELIKSSEPLAGDLQAGGHSLKPRLDCDDCCLAFMEGIRRDCKDVNCYSSDRWRPCRLCDHDRATPMLNPKCCESCSTCRNRYFGRLSFEDYCHRRMDLQAGEPVLSNVCRIIFYHYICQAVMLFFGFCVAFFVKGFNYTSIRIVYHYWTKIREMISTAPVESSVVENVGEVVPEPSNSELIVYLAQDPDSTEDQNRFRNLFRDLSQRVVSTIDKNKDNGVLVLLTTLAASAVILKCLWKTNAMFSELQGNRFVSQRNDDDSDEEEDVWKRKTYTVTPLDLQDKSRGWKSLNKSEVCEKLSRNCVTVRVRGEHKYIPTGAIFLRGNYLLINTHALHRRDGGDLKIDLIFEPQVRGASQNILNLLVCSSQIHDMGGDLSIIMIPQIAPRADIMTLMPRKSFKANCNGYYVYRNQSGELDTTFNVKNANFQEGASHTTIRDEYGELEYFDVWDAVTTKKTFNGFCGSALILETHHGPTLAGIHFMGDHNSNHVGALALYTEMFDDFFTEKVVFCPGEVANKNDFRDFEIQALHPKSPFNFVDIDGTANVYGSLNCPRQKMKSMVGKTLMSQFWLDNVGFKETHWKPDLVSWKPWYNAAKPSVCDNFQLRYDDLLVAADQFFADTVSKLDSHDVDKSLMILDEHAALNGIDGVKYLDSMNFSTSAGFPINKCKRGYIHDLDTDGSHVPKVTLDPLIRKEVERLEECYIARKRGNPIFMGSQKDEPRTFEKIRLGKTRIFTGSPFAFSVLCRKYYLSFIRLVQSNRFDFECAVGINSHSSEWDDLFHLLTGFSGRMIDGDYKEFDKRMMAMIIFEVLMIPKKFLELSRPLTKDEISIYHGLAYDTAFAFINFNGDLVSFLRGHVSGGTATVIINCMAGSIYQRLAYMANSPRRECNSFKDNVCLITYGDDFMMSVKPEVLEWFNFETIQSHLATIGVILTKADKCSGSYDFKTIDDIDFLKRRFKYHSELGRVVGPLAMESIHKSFVVAVASKSITREAQCVAIMSSALRELYFHGRNTFDRYEILINRCLDELDLRIYVGRRDFLSYDEYTCEYMKEYPQIFPDRENTDLSNMVLQGRCLQCEEILAKHQKTKLLLRNKYLTIRKGVAGVLRNSLKPISTTHCSYCEATGVTSPCSVENGHCVLTRLGVPQSLYLEKNLASIHRIVRWLEGDGPYPSELIINRTTKNYRRSARADQKFDANFSVSKTLVDSEDSDQEFKYDQMIIQSGEETPNLSTTEENGLVEYLDENDGQILSFSTITDNTFYDGFAANANLGEFLSRPVNTKTFVWDENNELDELFYPWLDFFNYPAIKRKLYNYSLLSCNLVVKIVVNASPFYYGLAYGVYTPLYETITPNSIVEVVGSEIHNVPLSQRPHICIYPQCSQGGEMKLPFMYYKNWLRVNNGTDFQHMGRFNLRSFTTLLNSNSVIGSGATIQVFVHAEDVKLSGPTFAGPLEAGDEYSEKDGAISGPSSAIAKVTGALGAVPYIGPYMTATSFVATKISEVAKFFGFTNVPVLKDSIPVKNVPFHGFASTEISTPIEKLSLDDKNELAIDSRVCGLNLKDELLIRNFVGKESWIYTTSWEANAVEDEGLFYCAVRPELIRAASGVRQATPMAFLDRYFQYWRGDIIFRVRVICSKFHRGRLRFTWDPDHPISATADTVTSSYNKVVDISETQDFTVRIPYMQALAYLRTSVGLDSFTEYMNSGTSPIFRDPDFDNGQITIRVLTRQTSAVASAPIKLVITVWGADNMEFAAPTEGPLDYSGFAPQAGDEMMYGDIDVLTFENPTRCEQINLVYMGETITSLRQMIRRSSHYMCQQLIHGTSGATTRKVWNNITLPRFPLQYGYDPNGINLSNSLVTPGVNKKSNLVKSSLLTNLAPCFVAQRGSIVYHINTISPQECSSITTTRAATFDPTNFVRMDNISTAASADLASWYSYVVQPSGAQGRNLSNQHSQTGNSVLIPMYSNYRFLNNRVDHNTQETPDPVVVSDAFTVQIVTTPLVDAASVVEDSSSVDFYYMAGTDFSLHMFLNIPSMYRYNLPAPV